LAAFAAALPAAAGELPSGGPPAAERPAILREVSFEQHLERLLPLGLEFRDENERAVHLGDYFGKKPVLLTFAYYRCPMLCPLVRGGVVRSLRPLSMSAGEEFDIVTVSFDARETPAFAMEKKRELVKSYGRPSAASGWHFLTGTREAVEALTAAAGFRYSY